MKKERKTSEEITSLNEENYQKEAEKLLDKYGPEGCYIISKKLIEVSNEDMVNAMKESQHIAGYSDKIWT
jgi:NADH:ubiquinone oxidoreductase subunit F (NADH-binding)